MQIKKAQKTKTNLPNHFGINKTINTFKEHANWYNMSGDLHDVIAKCAIHHKSASHFHHGRYTPFPIP